MKTLILLAGDSKAFKDFSYPKYLIEVDGKPLVQHVIESLSDLDASEFIFLIRQEDNAKYFLGNVIKLLIPNATIMTIDKQTKGAACSALLTVEKIDNDEPLMIINGDQIVKTDLNKAIRSFNGLDGGIVTFESVHPKWSYVRTDEKDFVIETAEKRPISKEATAGVYYFNKGSDFVASAKNMIKKDASVNGAYFVCPSYNEMILAQKKIKTHKIERENYISLSSPENVKEFQKILEMARV